MQSILYVDYYAVTYPEGKVSDDEERRQRIHDDDELTCIATHLYDGLCSQDNIQPTMSVGSGGHLDDLSKLSDDERGLVLEVLRRDAELRKQELTRIEVLKSDVEALQHRLAANECDNNRSRRCSLCSALFGWLFRRGDICRRCQKTRVCGNCRQTTTTPERWVCLLCYKQQQLYLKSGSWFHRTFSGRRRLRRLTESESSTLTFRKDVDKTRSVGGLNNGSLPTSKSFTSPSAAPHQAEREKDSPTQHTLTISGGSPGRQLSPDQAKRGKDSPTQNTLIISGRGVGGSPGHQLNQTGSCTYPDENDRELLMLVSRNLNRKDQAALSTNVEPNEHESHADSVVRRLADAEVFRRGHPAAKRCLSDEFPESLRNNYETKGIRSYRTMEDLSSSSFRDDDGSDSSTNSARIGDEASDAERETCHASISNRDRISEQISVRNETGDFNGWTQIMGHEAGRHSRNELNADESRLSNEFQSLAERKSPAGLERKPFVTVRRLYATNEFDSNNSPLWSREASLEEFSPEMTRQAVSFEMTDWSGSDADESLVSEEMTSTTLENDLELLAWKAEIEQLFQGPSITYDQDWEGEIDSLGVLRDMVVWSGSTDRGNGAGRNNGLPSFPPYDNCFEYVLDDHAQPIMVEVGGEEQKGMTMMMTSPLPQQPRRYLRVFNDEDSLSIISEHTEPTGSELASVDFDQPASEAGFHSDDAFSSDDEESLGITLTDVGIDRTIDRIVDLEEQLCPPCDLDAEMDRMVATNQALLLSRTFEMSSTPDRLNQHPGSSFFSEQENNENDNDTNTSSGCESLPNSRSPPNGLLLPTSGSSAQISTSEKKREIPLSLRYDDDFDDDPTTSDPGSNNCLTTTNHKQRSIPSPAIQPMSGNNSFHTPHNNDSGIDSRMLDSLENGSRSPEAVSGDSARKRTRSEIRRSNEELFVEYVNVDIKPDYVVSCVHVKTKELGNENNSQHDGSSESDVCRTPDDCENYFLDGDDNQNDANDVSFNQRNVIHCSRKQ